MVATKPGTAVRRSRLRHAVGTVAIVAVLLSVAGGALLAWGSELELAGARDAPPTGEAGRMPADPLAMADMGGVHENYEPVRNFAAVQKVEFLTEDETNTYLGASAAGARMAVSIYPEGKATLALVQVRDASDATAVATALGKLQEGYGLRPIGSGVYRAADGTLTRAMYAHENVVVRLEVRGKTEQWVSAKTTEIVDAQREVLPADE